MMDKGKAKATMLKELSKEMSNDSNEGLKDVLGKKNGIKKVTVASDSPEGIKKGLSMAEKLMELKGQKKSASMDEMPSEMPEEMEEGDSDSDMGNESHEISPEIQEQADMLSDEDAKAMYEALKQRCE